MAQSLYLRWFLNNFSKYIKVPGNNYHHYKPLYPPYARNCSTFLSYIISFDFPTTLWSGLIITLV